MGAETTGRRLGIGLRIFARAAKQGASAAAAATAQPQPAVGRKISQADGRAAWAAAPARQTATRAAGVAEGAKRFGSAVWRPMAHTSGVLWLEITGLFFGLFALFFGQNVYKFRQDYAGGPEHSHFLVYLVLTVVFTVFTATQFWKARRKEKKNRAGQRAI